MDRPLRRHTLAGLLALLLGALPAVVAGEESLDLEEVARAVEEGDLEAARERMEALREEDPDDPRARFVHAQILVREGDEEEAVELLEELLEDHPDLPEPYNNLAVLLAKQGELEAARDALEKGLATSEAYSTLYENLSTVYVEMARRSYAQALQVDPDEEREEPGLRELATLKEPRGRASLMASVGDDAGDGSGGDAPGGDGEAKDQTAAGDGADRPAEEAPDAEGKAGSSRSDNDSLDLRADEAVSDAVADRLQAWARAWSEQAVEEYIDAYAADYAPEGESREQWEERRNRRIQRPDWIRVELDRIEVWETGPDRATAIVRQHYDADSYADVTLKSLQMVREDGRWVISGEQTLKVLEQ
ncbi:tetratricopeptide repeat protein [Thiohalospira sp.]|uniref:tetratricopeptide repeat protein n=1 Tax=Thiohalospira sp. TaxID=3080549 RepID=UPI00397F38DC